MKIGVEKLYRGRVGLAFGCEKDTVSFSTILSEKEAKRLLRRLKKVTGADDNNDGKDDGE